MGGKKISYYYDEDTANYCLGGGSVMRPHRVRMTNSLVKEYGLDNKMIISRPMELSEDDLEKFHADEYVQFLKNVTPDNQDQYAKQMRRFNLGPSGEADCPVFDGMFDYCLSYTGGSVDAADMILKKEADICLNWSGGMHHAKKGEASGFCYVNDIVLAILELLKVYHRVLYVDIDIHHGDGVEEAFYLTDRVMTVSFHKYGDFFPGTGALEDKGYLNGKNYALNAPLKQGMNDEGYKYIYEPVMQQVVERYQPDAIVMCGGADSLAGDRLGCFNLSLEGHSNCMEFLSKFNIPMLVLGGGGYTLRNVARCWTYETGRLNNIHLSNDIPLSKQSEHYFYLDSNKLRIQVSNMKNANSQLDLETIKMDLLQQLQELQPPSGAQLVTAPPLMGARGGQDIAEEDPEIRGGGQEYEDRRVVNDGYDSDEEKPTKGRAKHSNFEYFRSNQNKPTDNSQPNGPATLTQQNKNLLNLQNESAFKNSNGFTLIDKHATDHAYGNGQGFKENIQFQDGLKRDRETLGSNNIGQPQSKIQKILRFNSREGKVEQLNAYQKQPSIQQKQQQWQPTQTDTESDSGPQQPTESEPHNEREATRKIQENFDSDEGSESEDEQPSSNQQNVVKEETANTLQNSKQGTLRGLSSGNQMLNHVMSQVMQNNNNNNNKDGGEDSRLNGPQLTMTPTKKVKVTKNTGLTPTNPNGSNEQLANYSSLYSNQNNNSNNNLTPSNTNLQGQPNRPIPKLMSELISQSQAPYLQQGQGQMPQLAPFQQINPILGATLLNKNNNQKMYPENPANNQQEGYGEYR